MSINKYINSKKNKEIRERKGKEKKICSSTRNSLLLLLSSHNSHKNIEGIFLLTFNFFITIFRLFFTSFFIFLRAVLLF